MGSYRVISSDSELDSIEFNEETAAREIELRAATANTDRTADHHPAVSEEDFERALRQPKERAEGACERQDQPAPEPQVIRDAVAELRGRDTNRGERSRVHPCRVYRTTYLRAPHRPPSCG